MPLISSRAVDESDALGSPDPAARLGRAGLAD
jgi:hypothetical protein